MDLQRSLLIGAIAVLSFMLLTEWVAFTEEKSAAETTSTRIISNGDSPAQNLPDLPEANTSTDSDEIPTAPEVQTEQPTKIVAANSGRIVPIT